MASGLGGERLADLPEGVRDVLQGKRAAIVARRRDDDECEVGFPDRLFVAHRGPQAGPVLRDELLKSGLPNGRLSGVDRVDRTRVDVDPDHVMAAAGNGGRHARAKLAETHDGDVSAAIHDGCCHGSLQTVNRLSKSRSRRLRRIGPRQSPI